jgi:hypothetical protein
MSQLEANGRLSLFIFSHKNQTESCFTPSIVQYKLKRCSRQVGSSLVSALMQSNTSNIEVFDQIQNVSNAWA